MSQLRLTLLGEATIAHAGRPLSTLTSRKAQALLFYLTVSGGSHSRSSLAGLLWSDLPESTARTYLRKELSRLRQLLGPYLVIDRAAVRFDQTTNYWLDVETFSELTQPTSGTAEQAQAVALYHGDFLDHFEVRNAGLFDEWVLTTRARLRERALQTLFKLGNVYHELGQDDEAIHYTRRLLELEPWREDAHRQLMRLLAFNGRRSEALIQYEKCKQILAEELGGVEPAGETTALHEQILVGALKQPRIASTSKLATKPHKKMVANLPASATPFIGREAELARLTDWITNAARRLITVVGLGGMGKTRLAIKCGELLVEKNDGDFSDGVYFVPLAAVDDVTHIVPAIANSLKITLDKGGDPKAQLLGYLQHRKLLLIMDNCEHLLKGATLFAEIVSATPGATILATSRQRLLLQSEHVFLLEGMSYPLEQAKDAMQQVELYPAVRLFLQAAQRVRPSLEFIANEVTHLTHLCRLVDGMPLALELAAGWLDMMPLAKIAREIEHNLDFLESEMRDIPERHRSIRAVFHMTWQHLNPEEQTVFAQLSPFRGGFTRDAAREVASARLHQLSSLHNKSLLQFSYPDDRFQMHPLLQQFAVEKLAEDVLLEEAVRHRHAGYYCRLLKQQENALKGAGFLAALAEIDAEISNIREAWSWAVRQQKTDLLKQAAEPLGWFYFWLTRHQEGLQVFQQAAESTEAMITTSQNPDPVALRLWAVLLGWQGWLDNEITATGLDLCRKALQILGRDELADEDVRREKALVIGLLGTGGPGPTSLATIEQGLALCRSLEDEWGSAFLLGCLASAASYLQIDHQTIEAYFKELWPITKQLGHPWQMSWVSMTLGRTYVLQGRFQEAEKWIQQARDLILESNYGAGIIREQLYRVDLELHQGRFAEAAILIDAAISFRQQHEVAIIFEAWLEEKRSAAFLHLGHYRAAQVTTQRTHNFFESVDAPFSVPAQVTSANASLALGESEAAHALATQAARVSVRTGDRLLAEATRSYVLYQRGESEQARALLREVLDFSVSNRSFLHVIAALTQTALWLAAEDQVEKAVELYALASTHDYVSQSRWFADLIGKPIAKRAANLSDDAVSAAKSRGLQTNLWQTASLLAGDFI